jgi:hypothetical protein
MTFLQSISLTFWYFLGALALLAVLGEIAIRLLQAWRGVRYYDCNCKCGE